MTMQLDLADIQGNILCDYGSSFPKARYFFLHIRAAASGRDFVDAVRRKVTASISWDPSEGYPSDRMTTKPQVAINIAFTFNGLLALKLPMPFRERAQLEPDRRRVLHGRLHTERLALRRDARGDQTHARHPGTPTASAAYIPGIGINSTISIEPCGIFRCG